MTSWRDSASQSAQDDLDGLLNLVLPLAEDLLGKHAEFYPFGGTVSNDGEAALTGADPALSLGARQTRDALPMNEPTPTQTVRTTYQAQDLELREAALLAIAAAGYRVDRAPGTKSVLTVWHTVTMDQRSPTWPPASTSGHRPKPATKPPPPSGRCRPMSRAPDPHGSECRSLQLVTARWEKPCRVLPYTTIEGRRGGVSIDR
jgi:hypothetical protein